MKTNPNTIEILLFITHANVYMFMLRPPDVANCFGEKQQQKTGF